jgi:hypothetical protein
MESERNLIMADHPSGSSLFIEREPNPDKPEPKPFHHEGHEEVKDEKINSAFKLRTLRVLRGNFFAILRKVLVTAQEVSRFARFGPLLDQADRVGVIHGNAVALVHIGK